MGKSPKENLDRITTTLTAWETHRAGKTYGGKSLKQFTEEIKPSLTARTKVSTIESSLKAAISLRETADAATDKIIKQLVKDVVAVEGEDSEFYEALGYVRESERKSGLSRKSKASETTSKT